MAAFRSTKAINMASNAMRSAVRGLSAMSAPTVVPTASKLLINGNLVDAVSGKTMDVIDPRTEKVIFKVAEAGAADVDLAVAAARAAFETGHWPRMGGRERGKMLHKLADLIERDAEELAQLETLDNGKPIFFSRNADIPFSANHFRYYAGWADKIQGKTIPTHSEHFAYTLHEPVGVCGLIIPWNFPLLMAAWKLAPALATGNTVVLKVAEQTPLTALKLAELVTEAGFPEGVINILPGYGPDAGEALANHMDVDKIAFTGSTLIGKQMMHASANSNLKSVSLELGGKSAAIVTENANMEQAIGETHFGLFFNMGQCCNAGSRIFVHESKYDEYMEGAIKAAKARNVGDPFGDVDQGPQVSQRQFDRVSAYIQKGIDEGATVATGGKRIGKKGFFIEPTIFTDVKDDMTIVQEEIFGPVATVLKYSNTEEVIERANSNPYGLAAGVWSDDVNQSNYMVRALKAGTVWHNCYNIYDDAMPFGGYKMSGIGRDKGEYALSNYTETKCVATPINGARWH